MKQYLLISFIIYGFATFAQTDTIAIDKGRLPKEIFIKGYPYAPSNGGFLLGSSNPDLNLCTQNHTIYNLIDSSLFSGIVYSFNNREIYDGYTYFTSDESVCEFNKGTRVNCKSTTYKRAHNKEGGEKYKPWVSADHIFYYSLDGNNCDSSFYSKYNSLGQLIHQSNSCIEDGKDIRTETTIKNADTTFHGKYIDNKVDGIWLQSINTTGVNQSDTIIKFKCLYDRGKLITVLSNKCIYLGGENEILGKASFFNQYSGLEVGLRNFEFLAMQDQIIPISNDYEIILTVNPDNFNYTIPEKAMKKIIREYEKRHTTKPKLH